MYRKKHILSRWYAPNYITDSRSSALFSQVCFLTPSKLLKSVFLIAVIVQSEPEKKLSHEITRIDNLQESLDLYLFKLINSSPS